MMKDVTGDQVVANTPQKTTHQHTVADLLIQYLHALSVEFVFGIPGGAIEPLYNALARSERQKSVRAVLARHETGAAFMADGYATNALKIGVCCATTGPGATNLITGVASAYANRVPVLVITAQTHLADFGRGAFQDSSCTGINTLAMFEHCTRYNTLISHKEQFERKLVTALLTACGDNPGPVHLSIPIDVLQSPATGTGPAYDICKLLQKPKLIDEELIRRCHQLISQSRESVIVVGEGAGSAVQEILDLADITGARLVTLPNGKGLISPYHPGYRGVIGFAGHDTARKLLASPTVDTVICIGTRMSEWASNGWDAKCLLNDRMIHIDEQAGNFAFTPMAQLQVHGHIKMVILKLLEQFDAGEAKTKPRQPASSGESKRHFALDDEQGYLDASSPVKPQHLMKALSDLLPPGTRYVADTGASLAWAIHYLHPYDRRVNGLRAVNGMVFRGCLDFSAMGWAIGFAVGGALGNPKQPMVCITGDGSLLMSGQELSVAVQENLNVIFIVLNDSGLGMVKHGQRLARAESVAVEMPPVDFSAMANAMGAQGISIRSIDDLYHLDLSDILQRSGPTLLDVHIDKEAVPPIQMRIKTLKRR